MVRGLEKDHGALVSRHPKRFVWSIPSPLPRSEMLREVARRKQRLQLSTGNPDPKERSGKGRWLIFLVNSLINTVGVYNHINFT